MKIKIEFDLRLQEVLVLHEMAKLDDEIDDDRDDHRKNATDMILTLASREIAKFIASQAYRKPNESGFSISDIVNFLEVD